MSEKNRKERLRERERERERERDALDIHLDRVQLHVVFVVFELALEKRVCRERQRPRKVGLERTYEKKRNEENSGPAC